MKIENEEDSRIFMCECIFMNISAFCRFCIELIFYVIQPFIYKGKVDFCLRPFFENIEYAIGYILLGTYLMHVFPVCISLYVYKPWISEPI